MNIPNFEYIQFVDKTTGFLTPGWLMVLTQLFTELQNKVGKNGFVLPSLPTATLTDPNFIMNSIVGTIIYDSTTNQPKILLNDNVFHVIQTI